MQVIILVEEKTLERLKPLMDDGESYNSVIDKIVDYIGFHTEEFRDSGS